MKIPLLINNRDLLCRDLVAQCCELVGSEVYLIDNGSSYPPTLDWWTRIVEGEEPLPVRPLWRSTGVGNMDHPYGVGVVNGGPRAACWFVNNLRRTWLRQGIRYYATTDSDLDLTGLPRDFLSLAIDWLEWDRSLVKFGPALRISDLPAGPLANWIREREAQFWTKEHPACDGTHALCPWVGAPLYLADIDTTLAVYRLDPPWNGDYGPSLRIGGRYTVRHRPWYHTSENRPADFRWYLSHCDAAQTVYTRSAMEADRQ